MDILPGDVLFVWGDGILTELIEEITHGPSHVALFIDSNTLCEAQGLRPIGDVALSFYTGGNTRLEIWRDLTLTDAERAEMVAYAKTFYGAHYDYALIPLELAHFEFGVSLDWYREHGHRICSTYTEDIANHVSKRWSKVRNPAPIDEMNGGALTKIYEWGNGGWVTNSQTASA